MAHDNVRLRKPNFTVNNGYFYMFDEDQDNLLQKNDDGTTAFSYPLDNLLTYTIGSTEYDGFYFWSLEQPTSSGVVIKKWLIDNYICKLKMTMNLTPNITLSGIQHQFNSSAFTVEHYHDTFYYPAVSGTRNVFMSTYSTHPTMTSGTTLTLGPNSAGQWEEVVVTGTATSGTVSGVGVSTNLSYSYTTSDTINYNKNIWLFNNFAGTSSDTGGALYRFDANGNYMTMYSGAAYSNINACTFFNVPSFTQYGDTDMLAFVKGTNLLFMGTVVSGDAPSYYGSMVMDNVQDDSATVIPIYDIVMSGKNVYRLQLKATYPGESTTTWTLYNYQLSPLDSFVSSISMSASPAVIAANAVSTTVIQATVRDQFLQNINGRLVSFTTDDAVGRVYINNPNETPPITVNTVNGVANVNYRSGTTAREVKITAVVQQTSS